MAELKRSGRRAWKWWAVATGVALSAFLGWAWIGEGPPPPLPIQVVLRGEADQMYPLAFSPDGSTLATGDDQRKLVLWDVETGRALRTFKAPIVTLDVSFSPDGKTIAWMASMGNGRGVPHRVFVAELATGNELARLELDKPVLVDMRFSDDGSTFRLIGWDNNQRTPPAEPYLIREWATTDWEARPPRSLSLGQTRLPPAFSADGRLMATVTPNAAGTTLWDLDAGGKLADLGPVSPTAARGRSVGFTPDGKRLVLGRTDGVAEVWDVEGRKWSESWRPFGPNHMIHRSQFDRDGRIGVLTAIEFRPVSIVVEVVRDITVMISRLVPGRRGGVRSAPTEMVVWDTEAGGAIARIPGIEQAIPSPDGRFLATWGSHGASTVTVWKLPGAIRASGSPTP